MKNHELKDTFFSKNLSLNCRGKILDLSTPKVMGILNLTPDSFYDGGNYNETDAALQKIEAMMSEGADIIDIGAASSRPGAEALTSEEEIERLNSVLSRVRDRFPDQIFSIDTYHSKVARFAAEGFGIDIINDITAGEKDPEMISLVAELNIPYIIMHIQGDPVNMQKDPHYDNVTDEIIRFFSSKIYHLHKLGINDVLIDPGFGFGKNLDHNYELLANLESFRLFELPIVAGISRKSMIYKLLETDSDGALNGTTAGHMILLQKGVNILRAHDVREAKEAISIYSETIKRMK